MKLNYVVLTMLGISLLACEHPFNPELTYSFEGKLNGTHWRGKSEAELRQDGQLIVWGIRGEQDIVIKVKFSGVGVYSIKPRDALLRETIGGDVVVAGYLSYGGHQDQLVITYWDKSKHVIQGTCRFDASSGDKRLSFTEGRFITNVRELK
jgi:hypothetical protein